MRWFITDNKLITWSLLTSHADFIEQEAMTNYKTRPYVIIKWYVIHLKIFQTADDDINKEEQDLLVYERYRDIHNSNSKIKLMLFGIIEIW